MHNEQDSKRAANYFLLYLDYLDQLLPWQQVTRVDRVKEPRLDRQLLRGGRDEN